MIDALYLHAHIVNVGTSELPILFDESPETTLPIWPLPRHTSALASEDVSLLIGRNVKFDVNITSKILSDAIERYKSFITNGDNSKCIHKPVELSTINIFVSDDSEDLIKDRKYEVVIDSEIKDATIIASSPFGAM